MGKNVILVGVVVFSGALCLASHLKAQARQEELGEKDVIQLIKKSKGNLKSVSAVLEEREVDFDLDPKIEKRLRKAGADDELIEVVQKAGPTSRANQKGILTSATGSEVQVSREESVAFQAIQSEPNPDRRIQKAVDFEKAFPNSGILSHVYAQAAIAYQEKGDLNHALEYGEKTLKSDPENVTILLEVALTLTQPGMLRESPSETNARLAEAESDAGRVLSLLQKMASLPEEMDAQDQARKRKMTADAHFALGMVALMQENSAKAIEEFTSAIKSAPNPIPQYYFRLGDAYSSSGKTTEAIESFGKARELGKGTVIEQLANKRIAELRERKP